MGKNLSQSVVCTFSALNASADGANRRTNAHYARKVRIIIISVLFGDLFYRNLKDILSPSKKKTIWKPI